MDVEAIREIFAPVARVNPRPMFGGHGIYADGLMIGLEADGTIYLRVDPRTLPAFEARGLKPFVYEKNGKPYAMSYRELPDTAFDDDSELRDWVKLAMEAARRVAAARPAPRRRAR